VYRLRRRPHRKGPLPFRYVLLLSFVFFILSTSLGIWLINKAVEPTLMAYANMQTKKIAQYVINEAIDKEITNQLDPESVFGTTGEAGDGTAVNLNTAVVTNVLKETTTLVQKSLHDIEKGEGQITDPPSGVEIEESKKLREEGILYHIPLGRATDNALLANLGPNIPVEFSTIGAAHTDVETSIEEYGINNAMITVYVKVQVDVQVVLPFATDVARVTTKVPVAMRIHEGSVPDYYNKGGDGSGAAVELPHKKE